MARTQLFIAACFSISLFTALPAASLARDTAHSVQAQLESMNSDYRALYRERAEQVLQDLPLVLVVQNHTITAVRGTQRRLYPVPLQRYNEARAIVHAALGFHGLMNTLAHAPQAEADWSRVEGYLQRIAHTRALVASSGLSGAEKKLALQILEILRDTSASALARRSISPETISGSLKRAEPLLTALSVSIGRAHAHAVQTALQKVQADATTEEWSKVVAVVTGPMTPRRNNLETAVVASVLGTEQLGRSIFYSENIFDVDGALAYLRTLVGDRELSKHVFDSPTRMWEDLFAPVSRELVNEDFYTELR